jgi:hypothetical protein
MPNPTPTVCDTASRHKKTFNLNTYKLHALGNYTMTIRRYGTTDSYSTEMVHITSFCPNDPSFHHAGWTRASYCKIEICLDESQGLRQTVSCHWATPNSFASDTWQTW